MSEFILTADQENEVEAVILDIVGEGEVEKYVRELVWMRARVAELLLAESRLQAEKSRLAELCKMLIVNLCWCWQDPDGGDLQDEAERLGILEPRTVTQEMLDSGVLSDSADWSVGDTAYFFADWVVA